MEKLNEYEGFSGRLHHWRESFKELILTQRERDSTNIFEFFKNAATKNLSGNISATQDFSHIYRHKTRMEFVRISAAVMGIEFSYAAETAFVSPTLLKIGIDHQLMTLVWALSPLIGFIACPFLGSMSDRCNLNLGRRRPFIILLSIGVIFGLLLIPNGEQLGYWFGDDYQELHSSIINVTNTSLNMVSHRVTASQNEIHSVPQNKHPWGIFFTVLGTVLLDFDADACQSPARAYLLDICLPEDHVKGLSTFTIMAGLGGFMGYSMGAVDWDTTIIGQKLGGHIKTVFTLVTFIFIFCVTLTITSFKEIPLWVIANYANDKHQRVNTSNDDMEAVNQLTFNDEEVNDGRKCSNGSITFKEKEETVINETNITQDSLASSKLNINNTNNIQTVENLSHYLYTIIYMPHSLRMICLTNLFCWMAHVCYSLYFTDFVGEAVYMGDPKGLEGSNSQIKYEAGVRFGCWGMAMYSLSCACYSLVIERLIKKLSAKVVYVGGLFFYSMGMALMALTRAKLSVIVFSWTAGVMYSTLFTMPYLLVAHYHSMGTFELDGTGTPHLSSNTRGLGTDIAVVSSMVFLAQFILSICMGTIVRISGTTTAVVGMASFLSFCGAIAATKIMYLDL
ncbi:proton-associated sugar transporter A isoform X1 [Bactrocera dorsalis]|uniref:Proton-associated sugar transporter A isoform X1 n=2 Tax=Bactrocera dorsalis TaxID=27457 RepID=A0ABM3J9Q5_BACDO|nr:proton-associated sugar transporter A isoform X1 [Bactrocera dorsalis]